MPGNINFIKIYDNIFSPSKVFLRDGKDPLSDVNKIGVYLLFFPGNRWTSRRARCSRLVSFIMYVTLNHKNNTSKIYPIKKKKKHYDVYVFHNFCIGHFSSEAIK